MGVDNPNWPSFLDSMNDDPKQAAAEFYLFAARLLKASPPKPMRGLSPEDQEDMIQEIVIHCIKDNFRVLRTYKDRGKPFAGWLYVIGYNKTMDSLRSPNRESSFDNESGDSPQILSEKAETEALFGMEHKEACSVVLNCLKRIDEKCRLLIKLAAQEYLPREIEILLGEAAGGAKKIANDLAYCRKKLAKLLSEKGLDIAEYF
jgi:DNA-directed RNA polymerase specialized sigma24 family protein